MAAKKVTRTYRRPTDDQVERLQQIVARSGIREVAESLDCSKSTLQRVLEKKNGVRPALIDRIARRTLRPEEDDGKSIATSAPDVARALAKTYEALADLSPRHRRAVLGALKALLDTTG